MMKTPEDHAQYLRQRGFPVNQGHRYSEEEYTVLQRYGYWLQALAEGHISPHTDQQRHFLAVDQGAAAPTTVFESAWGKYKRLMVPDEKPVVLTTEVDRAAATVQLHTYRTNKALFEQYGIPDWDFD
jgi:uncharacterized protein YifE (UPF0438 family)